MTSSIFEGKCKPCSKGEGLLKSEQISEALCALEGWEADAGESRISRELKFQDFYHTMAFVNAVAWIANTQDHHPDLQVGYGSCTVVFTTHKAGGLTQNDFICAAAVNRLLDDME